MGEISFPTRGSVFCAAERQRSWGPQRSPSVVLGSAGHSGSGSSSTGHRSWQRCCGVSTAFSTLHERRQRLLVRCTPERESEQWEKTRHISCWAWGCKLSCCPCEQTGTPIPEKHLLSFINVSSQKGLYHLKLWLIACFNDTDNKVNHVYGNKPVLHSTVRN